MKKRPAAASSAMKPKKTKTDPERDDEGDGDGDDSVGDDSAKFDPSMHAAAGGDQIQC